MPEYTYKDIIIDPEDPRVEIGAKYWFGVNPRDCIDKANSGKLAARLDFIEDSEKPFGHYSSEAYPICFPCMIHKKELKKEPEKYVPFDLSQEKDRNMLRGKFLIQLHVGNFAPEERLVVGFSENTAVIGGYELGCYDGHELLENFTFLDGTPCGQEVTEA